MVEQYHYYDRTILSLFNSKTYNRNFLGYLTMKLIFQFQRFLFCLLLLLFIATRTTYKGPLKSTISVWMVGSVS